MIFRKKKAPACACCGGKQFYQRSNQVAACIVCDVPSNDAVAEIAYSNPLDKIRAHWKHEGNIPQMICIVPADYGYTSSRNRDHEGGGIASAAVRYSS